ncbi:MAG: hypothetical protein WC935_05160, partial [Thermoleophilia bacterium]
MQLLSNLVRKVKQFIKPAVVGVLALGVAIGTSAPVQQALAGSPVFNSLPQDKPVLTVRPNGSTADFTAGPLTLNDGQTAQFLVWVHNSSTTDSVAANTRAYVTVPTTSGTSQSVTGRITATNATAISSNVTVNLPTAGTLSVVPNSVRVYDRNFTQLNVPNTGDLFTSTGLALGDMQNCWQYMRLITFTATASTVKHAAITTYKDVALASSAGVWHRDEVTTTPGNVIDYKIFFSNTGQSGSVLTQPYIADVLPTGMTYKPNSSYFVTRNDAGDDVTYLMKDGQNVLINGQTIAWYFSDMPALANRAVHLVFQTTLAGESAFPVGTTTLTNRAAARGKDNGTDISQITNDVLVKVVRQPNPVISFDITKEVQNITTNSQRQDEIAVAASPGDTAEYTIRVINTGNQTVNAMIRDLLPAHVTRTGDVLMKKASEPVSAFVVVDPAGMFTTNGSLTLANVAPGNINGYDIKFRVTVNATGIPNGAQNLVNQSQVYSSEGLEDQDNATLLVNANAAFIISKLVQDPTSGAWVEQSNTVVHEGATLRYRIDVVNTGNQSLTVNSIRDVLPQYVTYVDNSLVIDPHISPTPVANDDAFFAAGINNFNLATGVTKRFEFNAVVAPCPVLGTTPLINTA